MSSVADFFCCACFEELDKHNMNLSLDEILRFNMCIKNAQLMPCGGCNKKYLAGHQLKEHEDKPESSDLKRAQT